MTRGRIALAAAAMIAGTAAADAQTLARPAARTGEAFRYRVTTLGRAPTGERGHDQAMAMQRRTYRLGGTTASAMRGEAKSLSYDPRARSRVTAMRFDDSFALGDRLAATIGWRGLKVSNRNANAATDGHDRLTAHDWFLPRATLAYRPAADVTVSLGYRKTLRAYEGAGSVGPLGLTRAGFDTLRATLRPERSRQFRLDGQWASDALRLSLGGFHADVRDALGFADHSYAPTNAGPVTLSGMTMAAEHRLTPQLSWSARYRRATGHQADARALQEDEVGIGATWAGGGWDGTIGAARALADALPGANRAARIEAAIGYGAAEIAGRPLRLTARLTDPSRLASMRLMEDSGALRATDRARAMMLGATMLW